MPTLKEIKGRIGSVKSTLKITSAMKLVSSAKLRKAQNAIAAMRPYEEELRRMLEMASGAGGVTETVQLLPLRRVQCQCDCKGEVCPPPRRRGVFNRQEDGRCNGQGRVQLSFRLFRSLRASGLCGGCGACGETRRGLL